MNTFEELLFKLCLALPRELSPREYNRFLNEDAIAFHHSLGRTVRNRYDLWHKNKHLGGADEVSHQLLKAAQEKLRSVQTNCKDPACTDV